MALESVELRKNLLVSLLLLLEFSLIQVKGDPALDGQSQGWSSDVRSCEPERRPPCQASEVHREPIIYQQVKNR